MPSVTQILPPTATSTVAQTRQVSARTMTAAKAPVSQPTIGSGAITSPAEEQPAVQTGVDASRLATLARQTALARSQQRAIQEGNAKLAADRQKLESDYAAERAELAKAREWKQRYVEDPYSVLLEAGLTADQAAAKLMNQPEVGGQHITLLQRELAEVKKELTALKTGQEESGKQGLQAAHKQIAHDVGRIVEADPSLEAMKKYGDKAAEIVVQLIQQTYDDPNGGYVMDTADACAEVEEWLIEQELAGQELPKVAARRAALAKPAAEAIAADPSKKPAIPTLSTRMVPAAAKNLTPEQRWARALAIAEGREVP